jgi:hypothetical protein
MTATLTEEEFSKHVKTTFHVKFPDGQIDLELDEVRGYRNKAVEREGMERFSLYFQGPSSPPLPQHVYLFEHDQMGEFEIFLVPLSQSELGFRYEAVFNYFKEQ